MLKRNKKNSILIRRVCGEEIVQILFFRCCDIFVFDHDVDFVEQSLHVAPPFVESI